ncbi:MAG TPA: KEOPS complex N(6)-L-threonylcarbamoyladenine synthase Kae1 [Candidatus Binatia bacterium]|nr:KEOPS complex N(6)-L-threonylcarbamoyladenine synthase Kae1 [Candidatus Binatia bacterium]
MNILGIESTAHTFGVGIITDTGDILANAKDMYQTKEGGMIPNDVVKHHDAVKDKVLEDAFAQSKLAWNDIQLIVFSRGPGLTSSILKVGREFAKKLAAEHHLPLVGANHSMAHLTIGDLIAKTKDPVYLYVSGPNTQVIAYAGERMRIFGETLDNGLGNVLDRFAREAGLGFPGGPKVEELAKNSTNFIELPYAVKGMDVSFAGLLTKVGKLLKGGAKVEDLCFSIQETAFAMLCEVTERAMAHTGKKEVLLIGGVAANKKLCQMLDTMCNARKATFHPIPLQYCGDQGVMIAWQGFLEFKNGGKMVNQNIDILPYERVDEIPVTWR